MKEGGANIPLDRIDKELLNLLQDKFPIESQPFQTLGRKLGVSESEVIERVGMLKKFGYIRRIGGIFDSRRLGYFSTLCAVKVPENRIEEVAEIINSYPGVTHNYIRNHSYNMWFTLITSSNEMIEDVLKEIKRRANIGDMMKLPAIRVFKVKAKFDMLEG
jgi:DNA-binding Lrp family transcriptional regulator